MGGGDSLFFSEEISDLTPRFVLMERQSAENTGSWLHDKFTVSSFLCEGAGWTLKV